MLSTTRSGSISPCASKGQGGDADSVRRGSGKKRGQIRVPLGAGGGARFTFWPSCGTAPQSCILRHSSDALSTTWLLFLHARTHAHTRALTRAHTHSTATACTTTSAQARQQRRAGLCACVGWGVVGAARHLGT